MTAFAGGDAARAFVLQWADDAFVSGHWLSSAAGTYGPDLEENLALGSIAQEHLGHARALYLTLAGDDRGVDRLVFLRDAAEFRSSSLADAWVANDWAFLTVKELLCALLEVARCGAVAEAASGTWRDLSATIARDVEVHVEHWQQWVVRLGAAAEGRERVGAALRVLWPLLGDAVDAATWRDGGKELFGADVAADRVLAQAAKRGRAIFGAAAFLAGGSDLPDLRPPAVASGGRAGRHDAAFVRALHELQSVYRSAPEVQLT
ncbi:MAG: ring,2-phenylacetyl-CoA epoxidase subunit PaaC [Candidatus Eremiobacteraeota bacterium]|jgi:ring-1,2-phenylacetyl-CoA epoxidase subunit PaaC|nr:ring,2-phenylacetyl-CoA epoxidase subunit PaaC [Candidatus Eremiobacteraeota bacterium]